MKNKLPIIGITMGDPVGIGPEILLKALNNKGIYNVCRPIVIGDKNVLEYAAASLQSTLAFRSVSGPESAEFEFGTIDFVAESDLDLTSFEWGNPNAETGRAMINYINKSVKFAQNDRISAIVTCPINKVAMKIAGSRFHGHTEMIASATDSGKYLMMMYGKRLAIVLVTIHIPLSEVVSVLSTEKILDTILITEASLRQRFGIQKPRLAVAGLNPHAGEDGLFGDEEARIILPAVTEASERGLNVEGPIPPDTVYYHAAGGRYDAVISMYHDQGLIPFKLLHFEDGVNTTLGLPIIRTSVDHGTAYDIAGTGEADPGSLIAAIEVAALQATRVSENS